MYLSFYLTYLWPSLVGLLVLWFSTRAKCHPHIKAVIFLIAQILIAPHYTGVRPSAENMALITLGGYIVFTKMAEEYGYRFEKRAAALFLGLYMTYWVAVKYLLPLGGLNFPADVVYYVITATPKIPARFLDMWGAVRDAIYYHVEPASIAMVGVSYIGFKLIHFIVDYKAGDIKSPKTLEFLNWMFFFPSLIAGPMIRFQDWMEQRENPKVDVDGIFDGLRRLIIGIFMKVVLADSIHGLTIASMSATALQQAHAWQIIASCLIYYVYLYCDFAGYSHIAIGLARFWNIRLPENFDAPYRARNLAEYWNRWHITLSLLLRDYLFYPISLYLKRIKALRKYPNMTAFIPPMATFLFSGIWHGAGLNFVLWGAMHGVGMASLAVMKRYNFKGPFAQWWQTSRVAYACSASITFFYVSMAFIFFCLPADKLLCLWQNMTGTVPPGF
ncbi:MAG: MBOAT family protein [Alphaproteobacteria bacterium]|nr:MBOAT family protein [Alphaproteobacteria bacterium]